MQNAKQSKPISITQFLWDAWCIASIVGIWPRFIEPALIKTTQLSIPIPSLPDDLDGLKILQFSDLHLNSKVSDGFLQKLIRKTTHLKPDIIVFTGDFLCHARFLEKERMKSFLEAMPKVPYGSYAILGNHDYAQYASINEKGDYDVGEPPRSVVKKGFEILFSNIALTCHRTEAVKQIGLHLELVDFLKTSPFQLLHNQTVQIPIKDSLLNLTGLGEYVLGQLKPEEAFKDFNPHHPGIVLSHNPDSFPILQSYPGNVVLCGHTHGGQVNLPWMWQRFTKLENMEFKQGLFYKQNKWMYVNKGVGSVFKFRWFATPELLLLTLRKA